MRLPWVGRATFEASENLRQHAQRELGASEARRQAELDRHQGAERRLEETLTALAREREMLLDRILTLAGQPALYTKPEPQIIALAPKGDDGPPVPRRVTFETVHAAARKAIDDGSFNLSPRRAD